MYRTTKPYSQGSYLNLMHRVVFHRKHSNGNLRVHDTHTYTGSEYVYLHVPHD